MHTHAFRCCSPLLALLAVLAPTAAGPAPSRPQRAPAVAFLLDGVVRVQQASGGRTRRATNKEAPLWRGRTSALLETRSPDLKWECMSRKQAKPSGITGLAVTRRGQMKPVNVDCGERGYSETGSAVFDGWVDSEHFGVWVERWGKTISDTAHRVVRVPDGHVAGFNGWLGPGGRTAIVMKCMNPRSPAGGASETRGVPGDATPATPFLAITAPIRVRSFVLSAVQAVPLTLDGKPFAGLSLLAPGETGTFRRPTVEFSRDGMWALLHGAARDSKDKQGSEYVVSLKSGVVRKLPGTQAAFL